MNKIFDIVNLNLFEEASLAGVSGPDEIFRAFSQYDKITLYEQIG